MLSLNLGKKIKVHATIKHHTVLVCKKIHSLSIVFEAKIKNQLEIP